MKEYDFYQELNIYFIFNHSNYLFNLRMIFYFIEN